MADNKSTGKSARKRAPKSISSESSAIMQLRVIAVELRCALSVITVAAHALREQNADIDADVACTLERGASASLHRGLERIEDLLGKWQPVDSQRPARTGENRPLARNSPVSRATRADNSIPM